MPVGRVQSLFLKPLSFYEFLKASNYEPLYEFIKHCNIKEGIPEAIHEKLLSLLHEYFVVGGMPAVVSSYLKYRDLNQVQILQSSLLVTYRNDFGKYASTSKHKYLQKLFDKVPGMIGQHFRYVKVDPDMQSRDIRTAIDDLRDAGLLYTVYSTQASGLPLNSLINEKKFKLLFIDIGLVKVTAMLDAEIMMKRDLMLVNQGMLVEQFVGQELLAYASRHFPDQLFYWAREKRNSMAEVDYVINVNESIIPIEVKAGSSGRLKSLHLFLAEKNSRLGVQISQHKLEIKNNVLSLPLYMIHELRRVVLSLSDGS